MKEFFNLMVDKYFGLLSGVFLLASILLGMQAASNIGYNISQKTISMGWVMVIVWALLITLISLTQFVKNAEKDED